MKSLAASGGSCGQACEINANVILELYHQIHNLLKCPIAFLQGDPCREGGIGQRAEDAPIDRVSTRRASPACGMDRPSKGR